MLKKIMFRVFVGFVALICIYFAWAAVATHNKKKRVAEIKQEFEMTEEQRIENENRPLPDLIYALPKYEITQIDKIRYGYEEEDRKLAEANTLQINKRDGVYYWDSNGGKPLKVDTKIERQPKKLPSSRKVSTFTATDGSGSIKIGHDGFSLKGGCKYGYPAYYQEYRLNENREFRGGIGFFPPRPDDWCKTFGERLNEEFK